jgi:hypothetical protein
MSVQVEVLCVETPCSVVVGYKGFREPYCLHLQGEMIGDGDLNLHSIENLKSRIRKMGSS